MRGSLPNLPATATVWEDLYCRHPLRRHHRSWNETMKAIQYQSFGDYSDNRLVDPPRPSLKDGEVLVAMRKAGVNPLDNTFRSGQIYMSTPQNLPRVGGQTGVGVVAETKSRDFLVLAISTAGSTEKAERARASGYEHVIDLSRESLKDG